MRLAFKYHLPARRSIGEVKNPLVVSQLRLSLTILFWSEFESKRSWCQIWAPCVRRGYSQKRKDPDFVPFSK